MVEKSRIVRQGKIFFALIVPLLCAPARAAEDHPLPTPATNAVGAGANYKPMPCPLTEVVMRAYDKMHGYFSALDVSGIFKGSVQDKCPPANSGVDAIVFEKQMATDEHLKTNSPSSIAVACARVPQFANNPALLEEVTAFYHLAQKRFELGMKTNLEGIASIDSLLGSGNTTVKTLCDQAPALPQVKPWCENVAANCDRLMSGQLDSMVTSTQNALKVIVKTNENIEDPYGDIKAFKTILDEGGSDAWANRKASVNGGRGLRTCEKRYEARTVTKSIFEEFGLQNKSTLFYDDLNGEEKRKCDLLGAAQQFAFNLAPWLRDGSYGVIENSDPKASHRILILPSWGPDLESQRAEVLALANSASRTKSLLVKRMKNYRDAMIASYKKMANASSCLAGGKCYRGFDQVVELSKRAAEFGARVMSGAAGPFVKFRDAELNRYDVIQGALEEAPLVDLDQVKGLPAPSKAAVAAAQCRQEKRIAAKNFNETTLNVATLVAGLVVPVAGAGAVRALAGASVLAQANRWTKVVTFLAATARGVKSVAQASMLVSTVMSVPAMANSAAKCDNTGLDQEVPAPLAETPYCSQYKATLGTASVTQASIYRNCLLNSLLDALPLVAGGAAGMKIK